MVPAVAAKAGLKKKQDKITKLQALHSNYLRGKSHFQDDGFQNYLVFY